MIWFKTRHEVKKLQRDIAFLTDMLKTHLGIKYILEDFSKWQELHPSEKEIPVTEGELIHFIDMLKQLGEKVTAEDLNIKPLFRGLPVVNKEKKL